MGRLVELRGSLTWDQGKEMHAHSASRLPPTSRSTSVILRSPRQHGSNENTNGLLRQYFPRETNFSRITQNYLTQLLCASINVREGP